MGNFFSKTECGWRKKKEQIRIKFANTLTFCNDQCQSFKWKPYNTADAHIFYDNLTYGSIWSIRNPMSNWCFVSESKYHFIYTVVLKFMCSHFSSFVWKTLLDDRLKPHFVKKFVDLHRKPCISIEKKHVWWWKPQI